MTDITKSINYEENRFTSLSDFKWCIDCGGEVEFEWKGKAYYAGWSNNKKCVCEGYYLKNEKAYNLLSNDECTKEAIEGLEADDADGLLEYIIDGERLRDIITKVSVIDRTL